MKPYGLFYWPKSFNESEHPRGQPDNAGKFTAGSGGGHGMMEEKEPTQDAKEGVKKGAEKFDFDKAADELSEKFEAETERIEKLREREDSNFERKHEKLSDKITRQWEQENEEIQESMERVRDEVATGVYNEEFEKAGVPNPFKPGEENPEGLAALHLKMSDSEFSFIKQVVAKCEARTTQADDGIVQEEKRREDLAQKRLDKRSAELDELYDKESQEIADRRKAEDAARQEAYDVEFGKLYDKYQQEEPEDDE